MTQYACQPKTRQELEEIIKERLMKYGPSCDLNDIDVSKITSMTFLFSPFGWEDEMKELLFDFNGDISKWNVENVKRMDYMFYGCEKFKCNLSRWNVKNVKRMDCMFSYCPVKPLWYNMISF